MDDTFEQLQALYEGRPPFPDNPWAPLEVNPNPSISLEDLSRKVDELDEMRKILDDDNVHPALQYTLKVAIRDLRRSIAAQAPRPNPNANTPEDDERIEDLKYNRKLREIEFRKDNPWYKP